MLLLCRPDRERMLRDKSGRSPSQVRVPGFAASWTPCRPRMCRALSLHQNLTIPKSWGRPNSSICNQDAMAFSTALVLPGLGDSCALLPSLLLISACAKLHSSSWWEPVIPIGSKAEAKARPDKPFALCEDHPCTRQAL